MRNKLWNAVLGILIVAQSVTIWSLVLDRKRRDANALKIDHCVEARATVCEVDGIKIYITYRKGMVTMRKKP